MSENLRGRASLPFRLSLPNMTGEAAIIEGRTRDMRATGLSLILPAIRFGDQEITGEDQKLSIMLELPGGPIAMQVAPVRYERLSGEETSEAYLVGARITEINPPPSSFETGYAMHTAACINKLPRIALFFYEVG